MKPAIEQLKNIFLLFFWISTFSSGICQELTDNAAYFSFDEGNGNGLSVLATEGTRLFYLGETQHRLQATPQLTLKVLKYLNQEANVNILALEHGYSTAYLINRYLATKDSTLLRQISRNTMYWGVENYIFFQDLSEMNDNLPEAKKIIAENIDVEYKAESAVLALNLLMEKKNIPDALEETLGEIRSIFEAKRSHRESYDGLMAFHYYDRPALVSLISKTIKHLDDNEQVYKDFFQDDHVHFREIMNGLDRGYVNYNYENPTKNVHQRDDFMYDRFLALANKYPDSGMLCVIGNGHLEKNWSGSQLRHNPSSPFFNATINIMIQGIKTDGIKGKKLSKIDQVLGGGIAGHDGIFVKHSNKTPLLKAKIKEADYSVFLRNTNYATPFKNSYYGD